MGRKRVRAAALVVGALFSVVTAASPAAASPASWNPCSLPVLSTACGVPADVAGSAFDAIAAEFAKAASALLAALLSVLDATTSVNVTAGWLAANYHTLAKVGLSALLVLLFVQLVTAALQRRPGGLTRALGGTVTALLATGVLLGLTQLALSITDNICTWIAGSTTHPLHSLVTRLLPLAALPQVSGALLLFGSLLVIVGAFLLWAVLLFRKIAIYLVLVFAPVAFAGQAWEGSRHWAKRAIHALAALVFCKVAIVTVFVLGVAAAGQGSGLTTFLGGVILLGVACLTPWLSFRFFHFVDLAIAHEHYRLLRESPAGSPVHAASNAIARAQRLAALAGVTTGAGLTAGATGAHHPPGPGGPRVPTDRSAPGEARATTAEAAKTRTHVAGDVETSRPAPRPSMPPAAPELPPPSGPPSAGGEARGGGPA